MLWMFSFSGRINRLQYFFGGLGLFLGCLVFAAVGGALTAALIVGGMAGLAVLGLMAIAFFIASMWSNMSMRARRIRDIGWPVTPVMVAWFLGMAVNISLSVDSFTSAFRAAQAGMTAAPPHVSGIAALIGLGGLVFDLCLLFWPGNGGADPLESGWRDPSPPSRPYEAALGRKAAGGAPRPQWAVDLGATPDPVASGPAPVPAPTGGFPRPQTASGFGRRGL
jgi:uncharacterized membrane protein YhaH (DUF805 family)